MIKEATISSIEEAAQYIDEAFKEKQRDLVSIPSLASYMEAFDKWETASSAIESYNRTVHDYCAKIKAIRTDQESVNPHAIKVELAVLHARLKRHESGTRETVEEYQSLLTNLKDLKKLRNEFQTKLKEYTEHVTKELGSIINGYLERLGAGFRIDYQPPSFRGSEPAAVYNILIRDYPISPRTGDIATAGFRNTLSTSDKFVLAFALFLATLTTTPNLSEAIVILDDPFTSMDDFRRRFTANEINKLITKTAQVIVLSHEKNFLRLLWEKMNRDHLTTYAIQTGAPGMASLAPFDLEKGTRPRYETEREKVLQFLDVTEGDPDEIRGILRSVLEDFYRKGDNELFSSNELLGGIIRKIKNESVDYRYKGALEYLEDINEYTKCLHHAPIAGSATEPDKR